jgi:hypothetical protein
MMERKDIDKFFDSVSKGVLKEKWDKYSGYSKIDESVKVSELLESWNLFYENTFSIDDTELIIEQNINLEKSELCFGLFL